VSSVMEDTYAKRKFSEHDFVKYSTGGKEYYVNLKANKLAFPAQLAHVEGGLALASVLSTAHLEGLRLRLFYGYRETGLDSLALKDTHGLVGVSRNKDGVGFPILLPNSSSVGGVEIPVFDILRVVSDSKVLYSDPKWHVPDLKVHHTTRGAVQVLVSGTNIEVATAPSSVKAFNIIKFLRGERKKM
jgi:hypothetical protein